ncbi:MAG: hypothetical protein ACREXW_07840 [Gammaproteobacteria bacterium]
MPSENDVPTVKPDWMSPIETRQARADFYFRTVLAGQREWYSKGARKQKRRYLAFAICVIVLGVLISLLQVLDTEPWDPSPEELEPLHAVFVPTMVRINAEGGMPAAAPCSTTCRAAPSRCSGASSTRAVLPDLRTAARSLVSAMVYRPAFPYHVEATSRGGEGPMVG